MRSLRTPLLTLLLLSLTCGALPVRARQQQDSEDVVRVSHRVVFLDALVRDKRTSDLAADLKPDNFEVLADGKPRTVSYFSREGDAGHKPLALVIVLDLRRDGAGRFLRRTEILEAMAAEIAKLPAQDEVAVLALEAGGTDDKREWLARFTRNRAQVASALSVVPTLVAQGAEGGETDMQPVNQPATQAPNQSSDKSSDQSSKQAADKPAGQTANQTPAQSPNQAATPAADNPADRPHQGHTVTITLGSGKKDVKKTEPETPEERAREEADRKQQAADSPVTPVNDSGIVSQTTTTGKNGDTVTRTVYRNGEVRTRRVSKDGNVEIDIDDEFDLGGAVREATELMAKERPGSRGAIVWISDGIAPIFYAERDAALGDLTRGNVTFSALVADMKLGFKLFKPVLKPLGNWVGLSIYGSAQYLAKETGGEAVRVNRPDDYARGLNKIIGNLTGRYSLGFTLAEGERDDGQMHPLEVRVRARDAKGKERKLVVTSRRGFYMPKENETAQTVNR